MNFETQLSTPIGTLRILSSSEAVTGILFSDSMYATKGGAENLPAKIAIQQLCEYFEGKRMHFDFPYEQKGTSFQEKVWTQLQNIPFGKTISYQAQALEFGNLKAIRAIATANGKNQLSIVVPCHRVIGSGGSLTGYAGGIWRKKWLLEHERKVTGQSIQTSLMMSD